MKDTSKNLTDDHKTCDGCGEPFGSFINVPVVVERKWFGLQCCAGKAVQEKLELE